MPTMEQRKAAARRYGGLVDQVAAKYTNPYTGKPLSGEALLLKLDIGEGVGTSSAGAKGETQFMPGTRDVVLEKTGGRVDPWRSLDEAYEGAAMHLTGELGNRPGLEGYNPGMAEYPDYILRQKVGKVGGGSSSGGGGALVSSTGQAAPVEPGGTGLADLLAAQMQQPQQAPATLPQMPEHAAQPVMAGQTPVSSMGPSARSSIEEALAAASELRGPEPAPTQRTTVIDGGAAGPAGGGRGRVILEPNADRAGVPTSRSILHVAELVARQYGKPMRVGTGSQHSQMTASGNVSDHWEGRGVDVPASGEELTAMGRDALIALGVAPRKAADMAKSGGIFNIPYGKKRRVQVIVNTDGHWDHLHLGVSP